MSFIRNAAGVVFTQAASILLGLGTSVLLARLLSVEDRGLYAVVTSIAGVGALLLQLGWPTAAIYRLRSAGSPPRIVIAAGLAVLLSTSVLLLLAGRLLEPVLLRELLPGAPPLILFLALAVVPARLLIGFFGGVSRGMDRFLDFNAFTFLVNFGTLVALIIALVLFDGGVREAVIALASVELTLAVGFAFRVLRRTGISLRVDRNEVARSLRFGLKSYAQTLAGRLHMRVDVFMLIYLLDDPEQVAYYAIATSVMRYLQMVPMSIGTALFPQVAGLPRERAARFSAVVSRHTVVWIVLMGIPLFVAAPVVVPFVYGASYANSVPALLVLLPGMFFLACHRPLGGYFTAINRQQVNILTQIVSTVMNVGLNLVMIPRYGILGAAAASLVSYSLQAGMVTGAFARTTGIPLREILLIRPGDSRPYRERLKRVWNRLPSASS